MFQRELLGKSPLAGRSGWSGQRKSTTRSIRNKRILDTTLIQLPAPRLSLRVLPAIAHVSIAHGAIEHGAIESWQQ
jgi:hypothetical protein